MNDGLIEIHLSRLAEWVVRQIGRALLLSMLAALGLGLVAVITHEPGWFALAGIVAPMIFGAALMQAEAPQPYSDHDLGLADDQSSSVEADGR
jgi:hypothetical protein